MRTVAILLMAGNGARFGGDKTRASLGGKPVWRWSYDVLRGHAKIDGVGIVTSSDTVSQMREEAPDALFVVPGGSSRQQSARHGVEAATEAETVLLHDAARPFLTESTISHVLDGLSRAPAAAPAVQVTDTVKERTPSGVRTLDRSRLVAMQTPQGASREALLEAYQTVDGEFTDEMALLEAVGFTPELVEGDPRNFKITHPEDLIRARAMVTPPETRTGMGYDVHAFSEDPSRPLMLGGVHFPDHCALDGHSDADAPLHAAVDALLGAAGLGDIGQHFSNRDPRWKDCPSRHFLSHAAQLLRAAGWRIVNLDLTVIAETPRIAERIPEMRSSLGATLDIEPERISVKATTNEKLGFVGRGEGIAALAIATIARE